MRRQSADLIEQSADFKGLGQKIGDAKLGSLREHMVGNKGGDHDRYRHVFPLRQTVQDRQSVDAGQDDVHDQNVNAVCLDQIKDLVSVLGRYDGELACFFYFVPQHGTELFTGVCQQNRLALRH